MSEKVNELVQKEKKRLQSLDYSHQIKKLTNKKKVIEKQIKDLKAIRDKRDLELSELEQWGQS
jgi:hypothetical protein